MKLFSPQFSHNDFIPAKYGCDGEGISPPLEISEIPNNAKALALILDDPDAISGDYVHWLITDFEPVNRIAEGSIPSGAVRGKNSSGSLDYVAPCPPSGTHRYFFKLFALSEKINLSEGFSKGNLERELLAKLIEKTELIGLYKRD